MGRRMGAVLVLLGAQTACSSSHAAWPVCTIDAGVDDAGMLVPGSVDGGIIESCPGNMVCAGYSVPAADGMCHGVGRLCVLPCKSNADCASLGTGAVCSNACGPSVCAPLQ